ncbi:MULTISPECIES: glycerophosphodiester phosphodiesterase family protein [Pacificimonas]|nr:MULTISPECIES: glycerophosphodiester phosphodiesterase family protein [Pacificimonas]MBZ6379533.1 glycerophosphodiester phosphodiesterase [Pacificimonas aurantium]
MLSPGGKAKREIDTKLAALAAKPLAHRGLHGPDGPLENTIAAFDSAIAAGFGIELDVQLTAEAGAVVFHDATLDRTAEGSGPVVGYSMSSLSRMKLRGTDENISPLQDVLHHIGGRVPLLIEAKAGDNSPVALALAIRRALEGYNGPVGVMSFNPAVSRWYHDHFPKFLNGLVVSEEPDVVGAPWRGSGPARLLTMRHSRAKFLAYDVRSLPSRAAARYRGVGRRVFTWTVRSDADVERAAAHADQMIVEGAAAQSLAAKQGSGPDPT